MIIYIHKLPYRADNSKMSVYPSLEDMKVDHMMQVFKFILMILSKFCFYTFLISNF